jgi:hypothetical protein
MDGRRHRLTFSLNDEEYCKLTQMAEERVTTKQSVFRAWLKGVKSEECQKVEKKEQK